MTVIRFETRFARPFLLVNPEHFNAELAQKPQDMSNRLHQTGSRGTNEHMEMALQDKILHGCGLN